MTFYTLEQVLGICPFINQRTSTFFLCRHGRLHSSGWGHQVTLFGSSQKILAAVRRSHLTHRQRLVTWIKGDLGQDRNLFNRAHIQGNLWNPMKQMVILAIRTLFVNSDYNHSHQPDFSYVSVRFVTPRKTCWPQTWCKWSGEVLRQQAGWGWGWGTFEPRRLRVSLHRCVGTGRWRGW